MCFSCQASHYGTWWETTSFLTDYVDRKKGLQGQESETTKTLLLVYVQY